MDKKYSEYLDRLINRDYPVEEWNSVGGKNLYFSDGTRYFFCKKEWKLMRKHIEKTIMELEEHIKRLNEESYLDGNHNE